jgi:hypothetical protein
MHIFTEKLRNGFFALARPTKYGLSAYSYSNRTQAEIRQMLLLASGIESNIRQFNGGPFYIIINTDKLCPNQ